MKILLVGGGTAGHLFPLVALANQWKNISSQPLLFHFVVAKNNSDKDICENNGFQYSQIPVAKLRRYFSWKNFSNFFIFIGNIFRSFIILKQEKPDFIFSKGGFVSLPVGLAAKILKIPFYLHETDSVMGLSNRILAKFSQKIFTGFPSKNPHHIFVGNPVREEFFLLPPSPSGRGVGGESDPVETNCNSSLQNHTTNIFIFGGSQGSEAINTWARTFFSPEFLQKHSAKVLLVTGKGKCRDAKSCVSTEQKNPENSSLRHSEIFSEKKYSESIFLSKNPENFREVEFLSNDFAQKIHEADIVITRAGGSIFELAAAQKCTVLIPLPSAANNHQLKNAEFFSGKNAAILLEEKNLYTENTNNQLIELIKNLQKQNFLAKNLSSFAQKNIAEKVWEEIMREKL